MKKLREAVLSCNLYITERKKEFEVLKLNKCPLSDEERDEVMKAGACWHNGPDGEKTPAVWKSKNSKGEVRYVCNTHRAYQAKETLKGAINAFKFIKTTA